MSLPSTPGADAFSTSRIPNMPPVPTEQVEIVIRPRPGWIAINWRELWESRELLLFLVWRDVTVRYKQTVLGVAWAVLQPVFSMVVFTVIFGKLAKMPSDGVPYPVFVYAGLLPWMFFSNAVAGASQSLLNQQALLTKIYLPRLFVPAAAVGGGLVDLAVSFVVFAVLMAIYGVIPGPGLLALPFLVVLTTMAAVGIGLTLAAVTVTYRDFRYVIPFLIQAWLYLSPVIYPVALVPEPWRWVLALNPMTGIIEGFRASLLGKDWNLQTLVMSFLMATLFLVYGLFYFRKMERRFADIA
ncbi:MAG: ABC transporter permease [Burkholderiaceae bacterium]